MELTKSDELMLKGEFGLATRKALEVLIRVGEALGANKLINVSSAHIAGISIYNIGVEGVELIEELYLQGGKARVWATVNPMGFDIDGLLPRSDWEQKLQMKLLDILAKMGFKITLTCAPYLKVNKPKFGEHIAWSESNAVLYANTVLGARTNREGGIIALMAALTGRTYYWGYHLDEKRQPDGLVKLEYSPADEVEAGLLGVFLAKHYDGTLPLLQGFKGDLEHVRALLASAGAWSNYTMLLIESVSPEANRFIKKGGLTTRIIVCQRDLHVVKDEILDIEPEDAEAYFLGCPHLTWQMLKPILGKILEQKLTCRKPVYIASSPDVPKIIVKRLVKYNVFVLRGSCPIVYRLERLGFREVATNSLKACFYMKHRHKLKVSLATLNWVFGKVCGCKLG